MPDRSMEDSILQARSLIQRANYAVALTGAGISTPSGIPDFRSPESGLWQQVNPFAVVSLSAFRRRPGAFPGTGCRRSPSRGRREFHSGCHHR